MQISDYIILIKFASLMQYAQRYFQTLSLRSAVSKVSVNGRK